MWLSTSTPLNGIFLTSTRKSSNKRPTFCLPSATEACQRHKQTNHTVRSSVLRKTLIGQAQPADSFIRLAIGLKL